jgi:hypothetical protein
MHFAPDSRENVQICIALKPPWLKYFARFARISFVVVVRGNSIHGAIEFRSSRQTPAGPDDLARPFVLVV